MRQTEARGAVRKMKVQVGRAAENDAEGGADGAGWEVR